MKKKFYIIQFLIRTMIFLTIITCTPGFVYAEPDSSTSSNIFEIIATHQTYIPRQPWQKSAATTRYGYGINIGNNRIMTTEHLVRNNTLLEVMREQRGRKIRAKVIISDPQIGLAIIKVITPPDNWPQGSQTIASHIKLKDKLTVLQFDDTYRIQQNQAQLIQISIAPLPNANYASLSYKLLSDLNINGEGAPVMKNNNLAGLMVSYSDSSRTGYMIPYPIIKRFLKDANNGTYTGFAMSGFIWDILIDPTKRAFLGAPHDNVGIQVLRCIPGSGAFKVLQQNDVITELDGYKIDGLGFYNDPELGRLHFPYIIKGRHFPGEEIPAKIIRNGKKITVKLPLTHYIDLTSLIPENITGQRPEYMVQGGLVLQELTGRYLRSFGPEWQRRINPRFAQLYETSDKLPKIKGQHIVILSKILPHPINVSYQRYGNRIVTAVNSRPIYNMSDVFRIVKEDGGLYRLSLNRLDIDLVLDKNKLKEANLEIMDNYGISALQYHAPKPDNVKNLIKSTK